MLSAAARVSSTHLAQRFKELVGVTPTRYAEVRRWFLREHRGHALDGWPLPVDRFLTSRTAPGTLI